jgi:hypothetical protein
VITSSIVDISMFDKFSIFFIHTTIPASCNGLVLFVITSSILDISIVDNVSISSIHTTIPASFSGFILSFPVFLSSIAAFIVDIFKLKILLNW